MRRLAQMRLAAFQTRKSVCWKSGRASARTRVRWRVQHFLRMVEQPHS
jgi:hypothetical protein